MMAEIFSQSAETSVAETVVAFESHKTAGMTESNFTGDESNKSTIMTGEASDESEIEFTQTEKITSVQIVTSDVSAASSTDLEAAGETTCEEERASRDPNEVDWDGPNDPEFPMNWPKWRKSWIISILSVLRLLM